MPITFPAHALAALPFRHRRFQRLPGTALLMGTAVPDAAFWLGPRAGEVSHELHALLWYCVPVGLFLAFVIERWILPAIRICSPHWLQLGRLIGSRGPPRTRSEWSFAALAVLVGAITHLVWDSFSHDGRFVAEHLYPGGQIVYLGHTLTWPTLMHRISSVVGSLMVVWWMSWRYRHTPPSLSPAPSLFPVLVAGSVTAALMGVAVRHHRMTHEAVALSAAWNLIVFGFVGLWLSSAWVLHRRHAHRRPARA